MAARRRKRVLAVDDPLSGTDRLGVLLEQAGYAAVGSTAAELLALLKSEIDKWGMVIKSSGIKIE